MPEPTRVIYSDSLTGGGRQLMLDDDNSASLLKKIALHDGQVITEFAIEIDKETINVVSLTPDTLLADERQVIEALIERNYELLLELKRIILKHG